MADFSDVEQTLAFTIANILYPNGTSQPSIIGTEVDVFRGWPVSNSMIGAMAAGKVLVSVFAPKGTTRMMPRRLSLEWQLETLPPVTITVANTPTTVTFAGTGSVQLSGIRANNHAYVYSVGTGDTPTSVAAALGGMVPGSSVSGPVVTVPNAPDLVGRVGQLGTSILEVRRQKKDFWVNVWTPTPALRDAAGGAIDTALAGIRWMTMQDGVSVIGPVQHADTYDDDETQKESVWRRCLIYCVEYPTNQVQAAATMLFGIEHYTLNGQFFKDAVV